MLTVMCVWIKGGAFQTSEWVIKLRRMAWESLSTVYPFFKFVCITPHPEEFEGISWIDTVQPIFNFPDKVHKSWYKLNTFFVPQDGRVLYLDLDVAILRKLTPIVEFPSSFAVAPSSGMPMRGHDFNSSVMVWNTDCPQLKLIRTEGLKLPGIKDGMATVKTPFALGHGDQKWLSSLPMRVDLLPSKWVSKYLVNNGKERPPESTIVSLLIQGGKNQQLIDDGHTWIKDYWK